MSIQGLKQGFKKFKGIYSHGKKSALLDELVKEGQKPETLLIGCSDSRVDPAIITQSKIGDFFSVRNVAAIVPPHSDPEGLHGTASSIEYAVKALEVKNIVVMGHRFCGGVAAIYDRSFEEFSYLKAWLQRGLSLREQVKLLFSEKPKATKLLILEQSLTVLSLQNLQTYPWISKNKKLSLHAWYFDLEKRHLLAYDPKTFQFLTIGGKKTSSSISLEPIFGDRNG